MEKSSNGNWCVYVLKCRNNYLYIGVTNNLERRLKEHEKGTGSKFVRAWRPFELIKTIQCNDGRDARMLEYRLKRLKREQKMDILGINVGAIDKRFGENDTIDHNVINITLNKCIGKL